MLNIFRTNQLLISILLLLFLLAFRLPAFLLESNWEPFLAGYFTEILYQWVTPDSILGNILAILLITVQAFIINDWVMHNRIYPTPNLFGGLFYVLYVSCFPDFHHLSPAVIGNTFIVIIIQQLTLTYKAKSAAKQIFNVGFLVGLGSLFYLPVIFFFFVGAASLNIFRGLLIKERFILLLGVLTPFYLLMVWLF